MLSESKTIRHLDINYPLKYENTELLDHFFANNTSVETLRLTKIKPSHFNFLAGLATNKGSKLRVLSFEIFKMNTDVFNKGVEPDPQVFMGLQNLVLEELSIKASKYKEYFLFNNYISAMIRMF